MAQLDAWPGRAVTRPAPPAPTRQRLAHRPGTAGRLASLHQAAAGNTAPPFPLSVAKVAAQPPTVGRLRGRPRTADVTAAAENSQAWATRRREDARKAHAQVQAQAQEQAQVLTLDEDTAAEQSLDENEQPHTEQSFVTVGSRAAAALRRRASARHGSGMDLNPNHTVAMTREREAWRAERDGHDKRRKRLQGQVTDLTRDRKELRRKLSDTEERLANTAQERDTARGQLREEARLRKEAETEVLRLRDELSELREELDAATRRARPQLRDSDLLRQCKRAELRASAATAELEKLRREAGERLDADGYSELLSESRMSSFEVLPPEAAPGASGIAAIAGDEWVRIVGRDGSRGRSWWAMRPGAARANLTESQ
eukprot:TRINITY_DN24235_c0_g1_i1.p1 TRINITY_DN24235_c0_g1~~TRINITY_DN24235_c0_g1_i1.p1  ORF type:complete len:372 (+),score=99.63 TRINITY_DN24235_c0_g1_i1:61-1176(+)